MASTNVLRFTVAAVQMEGVYLSAVWPDDLIAAGSTLDLLGKASLDQPHWTWITNEVVQTAQTNAAWQLPFAVATTNRFFKMSVRETLPPMGDSDGDGLPNVYEAAHGTNPWRDDAEAVPHRMVGPEGGYPTLAAALQASDPFDIIELEAGEHIVGSMVSMPPHPVMVAAEGPCAVIRSTASPGVFVLNAGQTEETVFRNLYLWLGARKGFQSAFWMGGNLPWSGQAASATFENVQVRMPYPGTQYFGWHYYRWSPNRSVLSGCVVNAAGATWANGVYGLDPPPLEITGCSFLHFPTNRMSAKACGVYLETSAPNHGGVQANISVQITDTLFDASFTNALPLGRVEAGTNFSVVADNVLVPSRFAPDHAPDGTGCVWVAEAPLAWCGYPLPGTFPAEKGIGALPPLMNTPVDTDGDGVSDHEEAYGRGTDPWLADTDGDGLDDSEETARGTDPADIRSFFRRVVVSVTNTEENVGWTDYIAWGSSPTGWETNGVWSFTGAVATNVWEMDATLDALYVKAFRDLDRDGVYTPGLDVLVVKTVDALASIQRVTFAFGDVDGDGVKDRNELVAGTDPCDRRSYPLTCEVVVENRDVVPVVTNHVVLSASVIVSQGRELGVSPDRTKSFQVNTVVTNGTCYVLCWRDFDGDGVFTPDVDALYQQALSSSSNGTKVTFPIGDRDGDGVTDSDELRAGTDWSDIKNYSHRLSLTYTDVFQTTNALTFEARFGANTVWGPDVVRTQTWTYDFGQLSTTNHEHANVSVWDDVNGNGFWDLGETGNRDEITVVGFNMVVTNRLAYGNFDLDADGISDWWEVAHADAGLSPTNAADALLDADGDGLINLHEFFADCNPREPDGSNTVLSVMARSIDDRIRNLQPEGAVQKFLDYTKENGDRCIFVTNGCFWARDIDTSCVSMWNSVFGSERAGTLISPRHIVFADHFQLAQNSTVWFQGRDGSTYANTMTGKLTVAGTDIMIGVLATNMDEMVVRPAFLLPTNYVDYVSTGQRLPVLAFDYDEHGLVRDVRDRIPTIWSGQQEIVMYMPAETNRLAFYEPMMSGDSGNPSFLVMGTEVVLLGTGHQGFDGVNKNNYKGGTVPFLTHYADEIQQLMDRLAPGCPLRFYDFSAYERLPLNGGANHD